MAAALAERTRELVNEPLNLPIDSLLGQIQRQACVLLRDLSVVEVADVLGELVQQTWFERSSESLHPHKAVRQVDTLCGETEGDLLGP